VGICKDSILGTIFKPYYHLSLSEKTDMAVRFVDMGLNLIKEDETFFASVSRLLKEAQAIQSAIEGRGTYVPNVTHYIHDYRTIEKLLDSSIRIVMVDFLVTGFRPIFNLKQQFPEICVWGHRVGYWTLERFITMKALGTISVLSGLDFLHIGTPGNVKNAVDKLHLLSSLRAVNPELIPVFTKTTPEVLSETMNVFNNTTKVLMACGYFRKEEGKINWERVQRWITTARNVQPGD
jgi:ribulose 1,5-bisphosphate carboxylase large subunit-like protein